MKHADIGLVNTKNMFTNAIGGGFAVPAFNFSNMEQLQAIMTAVTKTHSPVILQVSESALTYMGDNTLIGLVFGTLRQYPGNAVALHLDHGRSVDICKRAVDIGFSSVMIDASDKPLAENIEITKRVVEYARRFDVSTEAELGSLMGIEDDAPTGDHYTNPADVATFLEQTTIDSLAVAIGTMHGAHKAAGGVPKLRFDILDKIIASAPALPLVLHGASSIPADLVAEINKFGGDIKNAAGIPESELKRAVQSNVCKINVDSDGRVAFTAGVRETLATRPAEFDPRKYLGAGRDKMTELYISEIKNIMQSENKMCL